MTPHHRATSKALDFIQSQQQSNGSFLSESSPERANFKPSFYYTTTFSNGLILYLLSSINSPQSTAIRNPLAAYLRSQASPLGSYNYWARESPEYHQMPYPDDIDDTFCALSALSAHDMSSIRGDTLAKATYALLQTEVTPGGPYRTWLTNRPEAEWQDIDIAVNATILCFLSHHDIDQPALVAYVTSCIKNHHFHSPYYSSHYPILYFVARAMKSSIPEIRQFTLKLHRVQPPQSATEHALLASIYTYIGMPEHAQLLREYLLSTQHADGSWGADAFGNDPKIKGYKYYWGSAALTAALCVQALQVGKPLAKTTPSNNNPRYTAQTMRIALKQIATLEKTARTGLQEQLHVFANNINASEVITAPFLFSQSLPSSIQTSVKAVSALSAANLYGWVAFTIYDDFIDDEGTSSLLPLANIAHRKSFLGFHNIRETDFYFQNYVHATFDRIDASNAWETTYCRAKITDNTIYIENLPEYADRVILAEKSIGHALPFLALCVFAGRTATSKHFSILESALIHYLIARQLHDDMHDWETDLRNGHLSFVVTYLLKECEIRGSHNTAQLCSRLQDHYWRYTLVQVCALVQDHLAQAHTLLVSIGYDKTTLHDLLERLVHGTDKTLAQQKNTLLFLDTYAELTKNRH